MNRKILAAVGAAALSASLAFGGAVDQSMATVAAERFVSGDGVGALLLAGRTAMPAEKRGSLWIVRLAQQRRHLPTLHLHRHHRR